MCAVASACAAIVCRSFAARLERDHVCPLHVPHVVLLGAEPGADHRANGERVEVGDEVALPAEDLERLVDERPGVHRVAVPLE